jgi:hypothetical protein
MLRIGFDRRNAVTQTGNETLMRPSSASAFARRALLVAGPVGLLAAGGVFAPAFAEGAAVGGPDKCARYGEGFVAIRGSDACVRLGGHVRVDGMATQSIPERAIAQDGVRRAAERYHVRAGAADPAGFLSLYPR